MEKLFQVLGCPDNFKTRLAAFKLEGDALSWWKAYLRTQVGGDAFTDTCTWVAFCEIFYNRYFLASEQQRYEREYGSICQLDRENSGEYMERFTRLASFVGATAGDAQRQARHFKWGLKKWVLDRIVNTDYTNVAQVAAAARNIELLHESGNSNKRDRDGNRIQNRGQGQQENKGRYDQGQHEYRGRQDQSVEHRGRQDRGYDSKRQDFRGQDQRFAGRNGNDRQGQGNYNQRQHRGQSTRDFNQGHASGSAGQRRSTETLPPPPLCYLSVPKEAEAELCQRNFARLPPTTGRVYATTRDQAAKTSGLMLCRVYGLKNVFSMSYLDKFVIVSSTTSRLLQVEEKHKRISDCARSFLDRRRCCEVEAITKSAGVLYGDGSEKFSGGLLAITDVLLEVPFGFQYTVLCIEDRFGGVCCNMGKVIAYASRGVGGQLKPSESKIGMIVVLIPSSSDLESLDVEQCVRGLVNVDAGKHMCSVFDDDGVVWFEAWLCVPNDQALREKVMTEAHSYPFTIHPEVKIETSEGSGLLKRWRFLCGNGEISIRFVTGLPTTQKRPDVIWVVVDRLTKFCFILPNPANKTPPPEELCLVFGKDYRKLGELFKFQYNISSSRLMVSRSGDHQTLEDMLRACALEWTGSWDEYLCLVENNEENITLITINLL
ncbi:zinc finger, CCHC-type, retrotransposon gag domain protein, partial [Tanacetum coccineum]